MDKYREEVEKFQQLVKGGEFFVFDTETTGLSPVDCEIIEFSAIRYREENGQYIRVDELDQFINPGKPIPEEIVKITGITDEKVAGCPSAKEAAKIIRDYLGESPIVVSYNGISFDEKFMNALYRKSFGGDFTPKFHFDVIIMAREKTPKPHKLIDMATRAGIEEGVAFHTSIADAEVTFGVMQYLLPMYEKKEEVKTELTITGIKRWTKSETLDRLYVSNRENASIYYDIPKGTWNIMINADDETVKAKIFAFAEVPDEAALLAKYAS